ncbi:nucleotide-diphospho-sugar transferase, partial [Pavlovales sp. CCMP2436]
SVVVPCYEEAENVRPLCTRLFAATRAAGLEVELLLVDDDSGAGTLATCVAVEQLRQEGYDVHVHVRKMHEGKGLSSAVLLGLRLARHDVLLVMDADLQHEPESVPAVAAPVLGGTAEFSVGSRNVSGGKVAEGWPLIRRVISSGATLLARPLTPCTDPMSGFFCLSRNTLRRAEKAGTNPLGYKIGLELMVRAKCSAIEEVPITFRDREHGESKLTMKQNLLYVKHLGHLYLFAHPLTVLLLL